MDDKQAQEQAVALRSKVDALLVTDQASYDLAQDINAQAIKAKKAAAAPAAAQAPRPPPLSERHDDLPGAEVGPLPLVAPIPRRTITVTGTEVTAAPRSSGSLPCLSP